VAPLKNYPADAKCKQAMHESGFPLHYRVDHNPRGGLSAVAHVEVKYQQP
jgi:hypothetical protein